jgi:hypothetical protein
MDDLKSLSISLLGQFPTAHEVYEGKLVIQQIDHEIGDLEARISYLQQKRGIYVSYIQPFRRIPIEIMEDIVVISLTIGTNVMKLAQICRQFRNILLGMPTIWSKIRLQRTNAKILPSYGYHNMTVCVSINPYEEH